MSRPGIDPLRRRVRAMGAVILVAVVGLGGAAPSAAQSTSTRDIDGDGREELLIGAPLDDVGRLEDSGSVLVVPGARRGAAPTRATVLVGGTGSVDRPERADNFGGAVELADVDGDGYADAIIGSPGEGRQRPGGGRTSRAGVVHVIPGGPAGLETDRAVVLAPGRGGMPGSPERDAAFGWEIATGDFDGDGRADIAISASAASAGKASLAGTVTVVPGSENGPDPVRSYSLSQAGPAPGRPAEGDAFGRALAVGDFDADGVDDLAVGVPGDRVRGRRAAGAVQIHRGVPGQGLSSRSSLRIVQSDLRERDEPGDGFGFSVAAGDLDCDGFDDLAVGVPNEDLGRVPNAGLVHVVPGSDRGLSLRRASKLQIGRGPIPGERSNAGFGLSLLMGDFDGRRCRDLAVGAPFDTVGPHRAAGSVTVVRGGPDWRSLRARTITEADLRGGIDAEDLFGSTLTAYDADGDGRSELVVGAPGDDVGRHRDAGSVLVLAGTERGPSTSDVTRIDRASSQPGAPRAGDRLGSSLQDGVS